MFLQAAFRIAEAIWCAWHDMKVLAMLWSGLAVLPLCADAVAICGGLKVLAQNLLIPGYLVCGMGSPANAWVLAHIGLDSFGW